MTVVHTNHFPDEEIYEMAGEVETSVIRQHIRLVAPQTPNQLYAYIRFVLGFDIPRKARMSGHHAPFDYVLHSYFEHHEPRDCVIWANRGGGKTQLGAIVTLLDMLFKPGIQIRILGGSMEQSTKMYRYLKQMLDRDEFCDLVAGRITGRAVELTNGSRVEVLSQSERAVRGQRVHKLRCDEVELFDRDVWDAAQMMTRSGRCGDVHVRASIDTMSTMHRPFGLMHQLVQDAQGDGGKRVFRWSVIDTLQQCSQEQPCSQCPLFEDCKGAAKCGSGFIDREDAIQQRGRVGDETWQAEMLCLRPSRSGTVYSEFNVLEHVKDFEVPEDTNSCVGGWIGGMDFGFRSLTVLLWAWVDGSGVVHVVDELTVKEHVVDEIIALAAQCSWPRPAWIGADPAGRQRNDQTGRSTISLWKQAGWEIRCRPSYIHAGIQAVKRRLKRADGSSALVIHPRCVHLIESLVSYHYPPDDPESCTPVKDGSDHAADALRYMIVNLDRDDWRLRVRYY